MPLAPGTRLGPYVVESLIGAGGMGEVYRAHDSRLNRTVAIKVLAPEIPWARSSRPETCPSLDPDRRRRHSKAGHGPVERDMGADGKSLLYSDTSAGVSNSMLVALSAANQAE